MLKTLYRATAAAVLAASFGLSAIPAAADTGGPFGTAVVDGANTAIRNTMDAANAARQTKRQAGLTQDVAQVPPITQQPVGGKAQQGLPTGFTYFVDASIAYPWGNIGTFKSKWLQGGVDAMVAYGNSPTSRFTASYYELQHYPYGFNSGQVPTFLPPGFPPTPGVNPSCTDLSGTTSATCTGIGSQLDLTTKDKFLLINWEKLITVGKIKGQAVPLVITPTYVARWSHINQSGHNNDIVAFVDPNTGLPRTGENTRTAEMYSVAFTAPFLKTPRMFGTFTAAPTWLVHTAGANIKNTAQIYQILYLEYTANKNLRLFFEPQSSRDYLPTDPYAQHIVALFYGATERVGKNGFVQLVVNSGGPTNYKPYGISYFQCYALPCSANTVPAIGGLKATQAQIQFGIGSPVVLPF